MQFCEGSTLTEVVAARGPLVEAVVRRMVGQLASALRYVHGQGVVHRDLKPSNVMIGRSGVVLLLDFGIVTSVHSTGMASGPDDGAVDATVFAGTPRYMAPEQFSPGRATIASTTTASPAWRTKRFPGSRRSPERIS